MAIFRNEPIEEVAQRLNICVEGLSSECLLAKNCLSQVRQRLGKEPMKWLFQTTGYHWTQERTPKDDWHGLQVFAVDGALFRTPDSAELRGHFGSGNTLTSRQTPYPMLRLIALMNTLSHIMMYAQISPYRRGEIPLADSMTAKIPDNSVTLFDKGFWNTNLIIGLSQQGNERYWMIPTRNKIVY